MVLFENAKVFSAFSCVGRIQMMDSCKSFTASFYFTELNYFRFRFNLLFFIVIMQLHLRKNICHKEQRTISLSVIFQLIINLVFVFILNEFRLRLSQSNGISLFNTGSLFIIIFLPIRSLDLSNICTVLILRLKFC